MLRSHGSRVRYVHEAIGISRLDALQAAVLLVKLKRLDHGPKGAAEMPRTMCSC